MSRDLSADVDPDLADLAPETTPWVPDAATDRQLGTGLQAVGLFLLLGAASTVMDLANPPQPANPNAPPIPLADGLMLAAVVPLAVAFRTLARVGERIGSAGLRKSSNGMAGLAVVLALTDAALALSRSDPEWATGLGIAAGLLTMWLIGYPFAGRRPPGTKAGFGGLGVVVLIALKVGLPLFGAVFKGGVGNAVFAFAIMGVVGMVYVGYPVWHVASCAGRRGELGGAVAWAGVAGVLGHLTVTGAVVAVRSTQGPNGDPDPAVIRAVNVALLAAMIAWSAATALLLSTLRERYRGSAAVAESDPRFDPPA